jgi:hypothetical protein
VQGSINTDSILHVLCNGDSYLSQYIKSPGQNMPAPLPRQNDATAYLSGELGRTALAMGKRLDAMQLLDLAGTDVTESYLLLLSLLHEKTGQYDATGVLESLSGARESDFARASKTETFASSLAALALRLKKAHKSSDVYVPKGQTTRYMTALAPSIQRARGIGRPRQRLLVEMDIEKAAGKAEEMKSDPIWATPCNESKHFW